MSGRLSGGSESSLDADELLEIKERFKELTKEKEMLRDTKSQSFDLIRKLEFHVKTLSKSREEDKKRIADLERELSNCSQEIDYLQDQLNMRNLDLNCLGEQVCNLQLKLSDMEDLAEEVGRLRERMKISEPEKSFLVQDIEDKEVLIRYSASRIEKLEESISSMALEYQCEIESTKLESVALEHTLFETKKLLEERTQENSRMNELIQDLELRLQEANKVILGLDKENKDLNGKLWKSDMNTKAFVRKLEEQFHEWYGENDDQSSNELEKDMRVLETSNMVRIEDFNSDVSETYINAGTYGNLLGPLLSKLVILRPSEADLRNKVAEMSRQIDDYECLIRQLKEELREERLKAKEEVEDLAQEMAELRYQLTSMLDEECKRRASIEQISLQRIAELESQIAKERQKSISSQDLIVRNRETVSKLNSPSSCGINPQGVVISVEIPIHSDYLSPGADSPFQLICLIYDLQ
ncbi:UNVERIFIED_CONTAM: hypothetical protein Sangu_2029400 [Sesamum angustifolium]|uniref:Uncharacterized protein n=1 Tax=Sesamum angustifolium TaxID=2727405 RepID=A0AAW2LJL5_9LAMI